MWHTVFVGWEHPPGQERPDHHQHGQRGQSRECNADDRSVGFTLIALVDGFVIVAVLDAAAPAWLIAANPTCR